MTNAKSTKKALLSSVLSLFLCFAMLLGTTFAWFTDSVTSANNVIQSGNLDIELEYWDGDSWEDVAGKSDILTNTLWEPGVTEVAYLRVANAGSLALKYQLGINILSEIEGTNVAGETFKLSDYIQFGVIENIATDATTNAPDVYATREAAVAAVTDAKIISAGYTKASSMASGDELYLALVVWMPTTVGNEANHNGTDVPQIDLGINVIATQMTAENDSFGNDYDKDSVFPEATVITKPQGSSASVSTEQIKVDIPANAPEGDYVLEITNGNVVTDETTGQTTVSYDITLSKDGVKISAPDGETKYSISIYVGKNLNVIQVNHKGEAVDFYSYDPITGFVTFETASFSPFEVICEEADEKTVFAPATPEAAEKLEKDNVVAVDENGVEYTTLTAAVKSGASKLYLKAGADLGTVTHLDVANDLVIYGNGAYISGGERDLAIDTYVKLEKDITVTIYNLHGVAFWGQRNTAYTANLNLYNCNDIGRVYINGTSGVNNIALYNCTASTGNDASYKNLIGDTVIYSNANGSIIVDGCTFTNIGCPVNLNHKIAGEQTVTVINSAFVNCSTEGTAAYYAPIRLYNSVEGANQTLTVSGNTFTYGDKAPINNADVLLNAKHNGVDATGTIVATVQTAATVSSGANVTVTHAIYTAEDLYAIAYEVNKVAEFEKNSFDGKTVLLMNDIDLGGAEWDPIGNFGNSSKQFTGIFDGQDHVISNFKITKKTPDRPGKDRSPHGFFGNVNGTVKNLTLDGAVLDVQNAKWAGALVGRLNGGTIENCHVTNSSVTFYNWQIGGLVGQMYASTISGCSVTNSNVNGYAQLGGLVGVTLGEGNHVIENCIVKNTTITQNGSFGGSYDSMIGGILGATYSGTATITINNCQTINNTYNNVCGYVEEGDNLTVISKAEDGLTYATTSADPNALILYKIPADYAGTELTVKSGVTNLRSGLFANTNIVTVTIPASVTDFGASSVSDTNAYGGAFKDSNVTTVILENGIVAIPAAAFNGASKLTSVNIPESVKTIGVNAFRCTAITSLTIPATVETIGYGAFRDMTSLVTVTIKGDNVTIPNYAFRGCTNLRTVTIEATTATIGTNMPFANASSNNPGTNNITFYCQNTAVADSVKASMGVGSYVYIYVKGELYAEIK